MFLLFIFFFVIGIFIILVSEEKTKEYKKNLFNKKNEEGYYNYDYSDSNNYYSDTIIAKKYIQKNLMTNCEMEFYLKIKDLEEFFNIIPQINLASIIEKIGDDRYHNELFRNIDFAIFTKDYKQLLLLIELNDNSHRSRKRIERDKKVHMLCYESGIRLITFYTKYPNRKEYVIQRIIDKINENR